MAIHVTDALKRADNETISEVLQFADPMVLMGLLHHAGAGSGLAKIKTENVRAGLSEATIVPDTTDVEMVRQQAFDLLTSYRDGRRKPPTSVEPAVLMEAMSLAAGEPVPAEEYDLHRDVLAIDPKDKGWNRPPARGDFQNFPVIVVGAGLAGINAAVQLKASGLPFTVLDRNAGPGGTWAKNRYPGARVDWPSRLYSHSFGADYLFEHDFAPRAENEAYLQWCLDHYELAEHFNFGVTVRRMRWNDADGHWSVQAFDPHGNPATYIARAVISAIGLLDRPNIPAIEGLETFDGPICHSSTFDPDLPLEGQRIAVIGTGASGLQMVPDLAPQVEQLTVFQRSPAWVVPATGYRNAKSAQAIWLDENVPYYTNWSRFVLGWVLGDHRLFEVFSVDPNWTDPGSVNRVNADAREFALRHMQSKLAGRPDLIEKMTPDYPIFANRPVIDNGWFDAIQRDNVDVVTEPIDSIAPEGVLTKNGTLHRADRIVLATGFNPNDYFAEIEIVGRNGTTISEVWSQTGPKAYWGVTVPHMPNFFMLYGPNANPRNLGPVQYGEWAISYILEGIGHIIQEDWKSIEVRQDVYMQFNETLKKRLSGIVSVNKDTAHPSYYVSAPGDSSVQSPWSSYEVFSAFSGLDRSDYIFSR